MKPFHLVVHILCFLSVFIVIVWLFNLSFISEPCKVEDPVGRERLQKDLKDPRHRVHLTMTTTPDRIGTLKFKTYVEHLLKQKPYVLVLNVPYTYGRTGEIYVIPDWLKAHEKVRIVRCEDTGPSTKILGGIHTIEDEVPVISVDDDLLYKPFLIDRLLEEWIKTPDELTCFRTLEEAEWIAKGDPIIIPEGYSGCITSAQHMKKLLKIPQFTSCRYVDDHWLGWAYFKLGIKVRSVSGKYEWSDMFNKAEHDQFKGWAELKNSTNRPLLKRLCLNEIISRRVLHHSNH